jgi:LuxR family maltose regulon positive regulatory protein
MLLTKLCSPRINKNTVRRRSVEKKLKTLSDNKIALISAPAGYGKTTAIANFLIKERIKYAWFSIDDADNDPVRFWRYVTTAVSDCLNDEVLKEISVNTELIASNITTDLFINTLKDIPEEIVLVLDDYHLIHNEAILTSVGYLAKYRPDNLRLIILSRNEPEGALEKLIAREMAIYIGTRELAFDADEIAEFFSQKEVRLTGTQINMLEQYTEGWVAGLIAASFSIREGDNIEGTLKSFSGKDRYVEKVLGNEVFSGWDDNVKEFLVHTSFLDKLSGSLCQRVTGMKDSQELLIMLSESNGFVIPLDHENQLFRYHHLFREYLHERLKKKDIALQRCLFKRAGEWYLDNGFSQDAVNCLIKAKEYETAFSIACDYDIYMSLAQSGEYLLWRKWMDCMPETLRESNIQVCAAYSWICSMENEVDKAVVWADKAEICFERIKKDLSVEEKEYLEAHIAATYANAAINQMDTARLVACYKKASECKLYKPIVIGEMNPGEPSLLNTAYGFRGKLNKIEEAYGSLVQDIPRLIGDFSAYFAVALAECRYEQGDLKAVYNTLVGNMGKITGLKNPGIIVPCFIVLAKEKKAKGDVPGALRTIEAGKALLVQKSSVWYYFFDIFTAGLYIAMGKAEEAMEHIETSRMDIYDGLSSSREFEYIIFTRYLILKNRIDDALILLNRLEDFAQKKNRLRSRIEILCLTAQSYYLRGDTANAMTALHKALQLGKEDCYVRVFIDEGESMVQSLEKYRSWEKSTGTKDCTEYAGNLLKLTKEDLRIKGTQTLPDIVSADNEARIHLLSKRELEVLKLLFAGYSNQEIAETLFITVRTVKHHNARIFEKLGVKNRLEAIIRTRELKLIE